MHKRSSLNRALPRRGDISFRETWVTLRPRGGGMPWKECHVEDERLRFIARLLDGESMTALCAEFGISRKTGYKIFERYKDYGAHGLTDRSRRPFRHANKLPSAVERLILRIK